MEMGSFECGGPESHELEKRSVEMFDADLEKARKESLSVIKEIQGAGEVYSEGENSVFETQENHRYDHPSLQISWPNPDNNTAITLRLKPITEGKGFDAGVFGYTGECGVSVKDEKGKYVIQKSLSLQEVFGIPEGYGIICMPTKAMWAIGKDIHSHVAGENFRTLYIGMGLLLQGREWMGAGFHEAGHLLDDPRESGTNGEVEAWDLAQKYHNRTTKKKFLQSLGLDRDMFHLRRKPLPPENMITMTALRKIGLTSYDGSGEVRVHDRWRDQKEQTLAATERTLEKAVDLYDEMVWDSVYDSKIAKKKERQERMAELDAIKQRMQERMKIMGGLEDQ